MVHLRTIHDYTVFTCPWNDDRSRGYYNPPLILRYGDNETVIGAGTSDHIHLFSIFKTDEILLLTINHGLYYAGLEVYNKCLCQVADVFMQRVDDLEDIGDLDELSPLTIAKRLYEYCDY